MLWGKRKESQIIRDSYTTCQGLNTLIGHDQCRFAAGFGMIYCTYKTGHMRGYLMSVEHFLYKSFFYILKSPRLIQMFNYFLAPSLATEIFCASWMQSEVFEALKFKP